MPTGKRERNWSPKNVSKNIFLFPGKGHSLPGVETNLPISQPFPESFQRGERYKALRSLNRSRGFFFSGVIFSGYPSIRINRSSSQESVKTRESYGMGFRITLPVTHQTAPSLSKSILRIKRLFQFHGRGNNIPTTYKG